MAERGWLSIRRPGKEGEGDINLIGGLKAVGRGVKSAAQAVAKNPVAQVGLSILNPGVAPVVAAAVNARSKADTSDPNAGSTADATVNRNKEEPVTPYQQAMADANAEIADLGRRLGAANVGGHYVARSVSEDVADEIRNKHLEQIVLNRLEYSINEHGHVSRDPTDIPGRDDDPYEYSDRQRLGGVNPESRRGQQILHEDLTPDDPNPSSHEEILQDIEDLDPGEYDPLLEETLTYEDTKDVLPEPKPGESPTEIRNTREQARLAARNRQSGGGNHRNIQGALPLSAVPAGREQELQNGRIRMQGKWYLVVGSALDQYLIPEKSGAGSVILAR